jgi:hypothetical protein
VKCIYGCGEDYVPGHYIKCRIVGNSLIETKTVNEEDFGVEDVEASILGGADQESKQIKRCKVVDGIRICKVKRCGKPALYKKGYCEKHQLEKYRAYSKLRTRKHQEAKAHK